MTKATYEVNVKMGRRIVEAGHGWHVTCNFRRHATHVQL